MATALSAEFGRRKSDPAAFTEEQLSAGAYDKMAVGGIAGDGSLCHHSGNAGRRKTWKTERHVCTYRIFPGQDQCISEEFDGTGAGGEGAARYI